MNVIAIASIIGLLTLLFGFLIMFLLTRFSVAVVNNEAAIDGDAKERQAINPQVTQGHSLNAQADVKEQLVQARLLAATQAAGMERGANVGIGRLATTDARENKKTASKGVEQDPITAVKIAHFHTWQGLTIDRTKLAAPAAAVAATGSTKMVKRKLVAGKDYPVVAITDEMSSAEKRQARIANAKAKSSAYKALKESGQMMVAEAVAAPVAAAPAAAAVSTAASNIPEPVLVELTDDMSPDEKRAARIANSKAKSAYNKALKAAGIDPKAAAEDAAAAASGSVAAAPAVAEAPVADSAALASIPAPDLIEMTDDMSPDEIRSARIANSKAKSAYKKALKAAGIDPKTVDI